MIYKINLSEESEIDLMESYIFYETRRHNLGKDFISIIDEKLILISQSPFTYPVVLKDIRKFVVKEFPFLIYYIVDIDRIYIIGILHAKRDPKMLGQRKSGSN